MPENRIQVGHVSLDRDSAQSLLRRYEWLMDFVMAAPDCARQDKQRELLRRIQVLQEFLGVEQREGEPMPAERASAERAPVLALGRP